MGLGETNHTMESALQTYRSHFGEKSALDIGTAVAEATYSEADDMLNAVKRLPAAQYAQGFSSSDLYKPQ